jgi:hypothetical protein
MDFKNQFGTAPPVVGGAAVTSSGPVTSPEPPPAILLSDEERAVYEYICESLRAAAIEHMTAGMPIAVIVRTFIDWMKAREECEEKGRSQTSKTGWSTPTPWADDEKRLKMELGQWLPKACLTIPSLARVRKDTGPQGQQDDLFANLVSHGRNFPQKSSSH